MSCAIAKSTSAASISGTTGFFRSGFLPPISSAPTHRLCAQFLEPVEVVAAVAHHPIGLADIAKLLGQLQHADVRANDLLLFVSWDVCLETLRAARERRLGERSCSRPPLCSPASFEPCGKMKSKLLQVRLFDGTDTSLIRMNIRCNFRSSIQVRSHRRRIGAEGGWTLRKRGLNKICALREIAVHVIAAGGDHASNLNGRSQVWRSAPRGREAKVTRHSKNGLPCQATRLVWMICGLAGLLGRC